MAGKASKHFDVADNGKEFGLGTVLAAYYNMPLERSFEEGQWEVINHMMGVDLNPSSMSASMLYCREFLEKIIPDLNGELKTSLRNLYHTVEQEQIRSGSYEEQQFILDWLSTKEDVYGKTVVIPALSDEQKSGFIKCYVDCMADVLEIPEQEQDDLLSDTTEWANEVGLFSKSTSEVLEARSLRDNKL